MILKYILPALLFIQLASASLEAHDQTPGRLPETPIAIVGGTIHPVSGPPIERGTLVFDQGKITAIGENITVPANAQVIEAKDSHVYPGLFEPLSLIGLTEISAVRASNDYREVGSLNPNVSAHLSINPDSEIIPVTRSNGVLLTMTAPSGGLIAGQASVIQLDGWTYEEMTLKPNAVMIGSIRSDADAERLAEFFEKARRYLKAKQASPGIPHDVRLSALQPLLAGKQPLLIQADRWSDIVRAVTFAANEDIKLIIFGGYDAPKCAALLKKHEVPVILSAVHRTPASRDEPYDGAYTLPQTLLELEIPFCISGHERSNSWNVRNLPYHAGTAVAFGLSREEAIKAITLSPAKILGVDDRVGSLEVGKDATLIICDGNPLETTTNTTAAWIAGRPVDLNNKQKRLYEKYQRKYE